MTRKYYKYIYSNIDLSMSGGNILLGGDSLAITNYGVNNQANYPWHVFDGSTNTAWVSTIGIPTYLIWSLKPSLNVIPWASIEPNTPSKCCNSICAVSIVEI